MAVELNGTLVFYWIRKKYPEAVYIIGAKQTKEPRFRQPMFWGKPEEISEHFVVLTKERSEQIVQRNLNAVFLCLGGEERYLAAGHNSYVLLPAETAVEPLFNYILEVFGRFHRWEQLLHQATDNLLSFDAIIRSCDLVVETPLALGDAQFRYVGYSRRLAAKIDWDEKYVTDQNTVPLDVINLLTAQSDFKQQEKERNVFLYVGAEKLLHINIFHGEQYVGRMSLPYQRNPWTNAYHSEIMRIVARQVERLYARLGSFQRRRIEDAESKELLCTLLRGGSATAAQTRQAERKLGFQEGDRFCLVAFQAQSPENNNEKLTSVMADHLEGLWPGSVGLLVEGQLFVLVDLTEYSRRMERPFRQALAYFLRESLLLAGVSREFVQWNNLFSAARQAEIALELGRQQDPTYWYFCFDDYAFLYLLNQCRKEFSPEQVAAGAILQLMRYDGENGTELNRSLRIYLECAYNAVHAARQLNVARSTFLKRLERIRELTGLNLEDFAQREYLQLSYFLLQQGNKPQRKPVGPE